MRFATPVVFLLAVSACDPGEAPRAMSRREALQLIPSTVGVSDGGKLGTVVTACRADFFAATDPSATRVFFSSGQTQAALAARRASLTCVGDQVFSVGDAGIERVSTTGVSFPSGPAGDVLTSLGGEVFIASRFGVFGFDPSTGATTSSTFLTLPTAPSALAVTPSHFYVGLRANNALVIFNRVTTTSATITEPAGNFGIALTTGDFSPVLGAEVAVASVGKVTVLQSDGGLLWTLLQPGGTPEVPSLATASAWLTTGAQHLDALLVGYSNLETVTLFLGSESVEEFTPLTPGGRFGLSVASAGNSLVIGAPSHPVGGAIYSDVLPSPPWSNVGIEACALSGCGANFTCFGGVACVSPIRPDGGVNADGGLASGDGGASVGDGGASAGDGGASAGDGGASVGDGGASVGDGGAGAGDGGAGVGDGGASVGDGGASVGDGGASAGDGGAGVGDGGANSGDGGASVGDGGLVPSDGGTKLDGGSNPNDGGVKVDAGTTDAGTIPLVFTASGCSCSEANGLLFSLGALALLRRRRR